MSEPMLAPPCKWCGYDGPGYWQQFTHRRDCPWYGLGGSSRRYDIVRRWPHIAGIATATANERAAVAENLAAIGELGPRAEWPRVMKAIAAAVATRSRDSSTRVGAVVCTAEWRVVGTGYNGPPAGSPDDLPMSGSEKHAWVVHAEENALAQAVASLGSNRLSGCRVFTTHRPCARCTRAMFHLGVRDWDWIADELDSEQLLAVNATCAGLRIDRFGAEFNL